MTEQCRPAKERNARRMTIGQEVRCSLIAVNLLVILIFSVVTYCKRKQALLADIDLTLTAVATMAREVLPTDYHDRITGPESVSALEFEKSVDRNNRLCKELGLEYIWSLMAIDGKIVFTTATSPDKIEENHKHAKFFEPHSNPELYTNAFSTMRATYKSTHDKWGDIRVALIPSRDRLGRKFLFGASVRLTEVERQMRSLFLQSLLIGAGLFAFSLVIGFWISRVVTAPIQRLTETIRLVAAGESGLMAEERGTVEQITLARYFNQMNRSLQEKIADLEAARHRLIGRHSAELKQVEGSLLMSEQRFRALLDFAVDGILIGTHEGVITESNQRMCELFGMRRDEIVGKHVLEMPFTAESLAKQPLRFDRVQGGEMVVTERTIRRQDGTELVVEMHTKMMPDGTYQSIYHDVSARKRDEESLRAIRRLLDETQSFAHLGGWEIDLRTKKATWTEEVYHIYGVGHEFDVSNADLAFSFYASKHAPAVVKALTEGLAKGESFDLECEFIRANGERIWVRVMGQPTLENGQLVRANGCIMDITDRKRVEESLRETRRMLEEAQEVAKLGAWAYDVQAGHLTWTEEVYRIHGIGHDYDIDRLTQDVSFLVPEHEPIMRRAFEQAVKQGTPYDLEVQLVKLSGEHVWVRVAGRGVIENGTVVRVVGNIMDISERKQAETEIQRGQERLARQYEMLDTLLQNLTVGVFMVEVPSGKPLVANHAARQLLGRGILPDADAHNLGEVYEAYKASDRSTRYPVCEMPVTLGMKGVSAHVDDLVVFRPDGTEAMLEIFGSPVKDEQGRVWASLVSFSDITERKRIEQALRDSENRYRQLFEMESDAILLVDNEHGQILDVNLAATSIYGFSREELLSMTNSGLSAEPEETRAVTQSGVGGDATIVKVPMRKHRKKDGTVFPVEITGRFFSMNGRNVHIAAVRDITERWKSQALLESWSASLERRVAERTAEVEKYARQLQALTGRLVRAEEDERQRITDVLHEDLQQILVASRMTLGVALQAVKDSTVKKPLEAADGMLAQSIRLTRSLVQDIAVPAVREGEIPFAVDWLRQQMSEKFNLTVELVIEEGVRPVSENVYLCLYRAIQELLFNVVKHAQVSQAEIEVRNADGGGHVQVVVKDRGRGFSVGAVEHAERTNKGFGLFSIRERLEGLGGRMEIDSEVGRGTTVVLTVPLRG